MSGLGTGERSLDLADPLGIEHDHILEVDEVIESGIPVRDHHRFDPMGVSLTRDSLNDRVESAAIAAARNHSDSFDWCHAILLLNGLLSKITPEQQSGERNRESTSLYPRIISCIPA